jgi:hypothetical protein
MLLLDGASLGFILQRVAAAYAAAHEPAEPGDGPGKLLDLDAEEEFLRALRPGVFPC